MTTPNIESPRPRLALYLRLLLGCLCLLSACSRPESLFIGAYELPYATVADAEESLRESFQHSGSGTLRAHLLQFGLGQAAILHQANPEESAKSRALAMQWVDRLQAGETFHTLLEEEAQRLGSPVEIDPPELPNPSGLGASVAAAVAGLEQGQWAGPLQTIYGWEVVLLDRRVAGTRDRAQVSLFRLQAPVGDASLRNQAKEDWETLPLSGNPELIQDLPLSFRRDRVVAPPE
ncbi:MAG: peptidyl-prolyl cis-trans isomerase [Planctomycetota bacterium]|jgi:hypothetical protein